MRARHSSRFLCAPALAAFGLLLSGCGDAVQEDRSINVSSRGNLAAFQHGNEGIFVADPHSGELRKVFDPDKAIIAVGSPLWSADETQAIFTTARDEPEAPNSDDRKTSDRKSSPAPTVRAAAPVAWDDAPQGRPFYPSPIVYTCWLLERSQDGGFKPPTPLFEAHCGHSGYIAANCAVRRSARGDTILFVDREKPRGHAIWSYDMKSRQKSRLFPPGGVSAPDYVIGEYSPDGSHIVCTAGGTWNGTGVSMSSQDGNATSPSPEPDRLDGIWIQAADNGRWWHIAESIVRSDGHSPSGLSGLIGRRPVFSHDGSRLAFVREVADPEKPEVLVFRGRLSEHKVAQVFKTERQILDPHWSPDASRLGFVVAGPGSELTTLDAQGTVGRLAPREFVRSFAGWNAAGTEMAYVVSEQTRPESAKTWSALLSLDPQARDALVVLPNGGQPRMLLSGMRLTFPQWSPTGDTISVWGTFTPSHRSWADEALIRGLAMRAGDPAAVIDAKSGSVRWLAINGDEQAQIGHALQLKGDFAGARERYREAEKTLSKLEPFKPSELLQGASGNVARRRMFEFLYWHCLTKLGEDREAARRLKAFEDIYRIRWPASGTAATTPADELDRDLSGPLARRQTERLVSVIRALAEAQALLSVNDLDGAIAFFKHKVDAVERNSPSGADERLGPLCALSQLYQLAGRSREFVALATNDFGPILATALEDRRNVPTSNTVDTMSAALADCCGRALIPLFQPEFSRALPSDEISRTATQWQALRSRCASQSAALIVDYALLGLIPPAMQAERNDVNARIVKNPARTQFDWLNPHIRVLPQRETRDGSP